MKILFSLVLLALISCGGKSGGGSSGSGGWGGNITPPTACSTQQAGCDALNNFKIAVENNRWGANPYPKYKSNYYDPKSSGNCSETPLFLGFTFRSCSYTGSPKIVDYTVVQNGAFTKSLVGVDINLIKNIIRNAELLTTSSNMGRDQSKAYAAPYGQAWIIFLGSKTYGFDLSKPLGANPIYYKDEAGKEFSYYYSEFTP